MVHTASSLGARFAAHYKPQPGVVGSLSASAEPGHVASIEAFAVRGFSATAGKLQYVKAKEHFLVARETILAGDYVELQEEDANRLIANGRAEAATAEEVAAAAKKGK